MASVTAAVANPSLNLFLHRELSETVSDFENQIRVPSQLPTPLIGRWADESFPLNSRQASEIVQEQVIQRQRSSLLFEDANGNEFSYGEPEAVQVHADEMEDGGSASGYGNSELADEISFAQAGSNDDLSLSSPTHISRCYRFDPYNITGGGVDVMYCCYCEQCTAMQHHASTHGHHSFAIPTAPLVEFSSSANAAAELLMEPLETPSYFHSPRNDLQADASQRPRPHHASHQQQSSPVASGTAPRGLGATPPSNSSVSSASVAEWDAPRPRLPSHTGGFATHLNAHGSKPPAAVLAHRGASQPAHGPLLSSFMPPPPPPRIMTFVLDDEGNRRSSSIYYHILTRWYKHCVEAQEFFVSEDDYCPPPNKDLYPFDEWADRVSGWWYSHFEHMQKKQTRYIAAGPTSAPSRSF